MPSRGAVLACVLASAPGCYKATFMSDPNVVRGGEREKWTSFFISVRYCIGKEVDMHMSRPCQS
jgi:hypothetical protein